LVCAKWLERGELGQPVQFSSAREAEKRWRYSQLRVESPAVKKRVSCKSVAVKRRLYVCCSYSKTVIIIVLNPLPGYG
jgi:hypothetical protein